MSKDISSAGYAEKLVPSAKAEVKLGYMLESPSIRYYRKVKMYSVRITSREERRASNMKYRGDYTAAGVDTGGSGSIVFEASDDAEAKTRAHQLIAEAEQACNQKISNRFWHYSFSMTRLVRIIREEIIEPVSV